MNIRESSVCPNCGTSGRIYSVDNLFDNARYDSFTCPQCGTEWRAYYNVSEVHTEVTFVPAPPKNEVQDRPEVTSDIPTPVAEASDECRCEDDCCEKKSAKPKKA